MRLNDLQSLISPEDRPIEFGFEKEFVLQAKSKENATLYNLNLASELIELLTENKFLREYSVRPEYSKCLVEIVSKPYGSNSVFKELDNINNTQPLIESELKRIVKDNYPEIDRNFEVSVSDLGSSPSCQYLNHDLSIQSDQTNSTELVLPEYRQTVSDYKNLQISVAGGFESAIGLYNHINSFHITFHPTYRKGTPSFSNYIRTIRMAQKLISKYLVHDRGNNKLYRGDKSYSFQKNIRDLFFEIFLPKKYGSLPISLLLSENDSDAKKEFIALSEQLLNHNETGDVDKAYSSWSAGNIRPRIVDGNIPALEIRQFGSNFSKTSEVKRLLKEIIELDSREFYE